MTRRFQISLRTSIVLMVMAAVLVGANVIPWNDDAVEVYWKTDGSPGRWMQRGWPVGYVRWWTGPDGYVYTLHNWFGLVLNVLFAVGVFIGLWALLKRPWRKPPQSPPEPRP